MCMWCSHWAYFKPHRAKTHCSCFQILVDIQSSFDKNPGNHPFVAETPFNIEKYRPGAFFIFRLGFNAHVISVSSSTQKRSICSIHQTGEASREQATGKLQTKTTLVIVAVFRHQTKVPHIGLKTKTCTKHQRFVGTEWMH